MAKKKVKMDHSFIFLPNFFMKTIFLEFVCLQHMCKIYPKLSGQNFDGTLIDVVFITS